jgi:hypothetical protein
MERAAVAFGGLAVVIFLLACVVAVALPYGDFDAMSLGTWSRQIAEHWPTVHFPGVYFANYNRPLFYVAQGFAWHVFGFHQAVGRLLSLSFALLMAGAVGFLALRLAPPAYRRFTAALAVLTLLLVTYFDQYIAAGLTDIPVAALVATTAALLLAPRLGRFHLPAVALAAVLSVLAKPSAFPALAGLTAAVLIGSRSGLRRRSRLAAALAVGVGAGLLYDFSQARYVHLGLRSFVTGYSEGQGSAYYAHLADQVRGHVLLDGALLGPDLRLLLVFALAYSIARLIGVHHRLAVAIVLPLAYVWSWLGPHLAGGKGVRVGILGTGGGTEQIAVLVLAASLLFALSAPPEAIPTRLTLGRLLVWSAPTLFFWVQGYAFEARALAPAWPPLVLLIALTFTPAFAAAQKRSGWLVCIPAAAVVVIGAFAAYNINGLGESGWRQLRAGGVSGLSNGSFTRGIALGGDFAAEINALEPQVKPRDKILTFDGRLRFFYLDQVELQAPISCGQLKGYKLFVLLESDEIRTIYGKRGSSPFWNACRAPRLTMIEERPGAFALFAVGKPRPSVGGCGAPTPENRGLAIEFGRKRTVSEAEVLQRNVAAAGFIEAKVEQLGCSLYRIVETGVPDESVGRSILAEARSAHLSATLVDH